MKDLKKTLLTLFDRPCRAHTYHGGPRQQRQAPHQGHPATRHPTAVALPFPALPPYPPLPPCRSLPPPSSAAPLLPPLRPRGVRVLGVPPARCPSRWTPLTSSASPWTSASTSRCAVSGSSAAACTYVTSLLLLYSTLYPLPRPIPSPATPSSQVRWVGFVASACLLRSFFVFVCDVLLRGGRLYEWAIVCGVPPLRTSA